MIRLTQLFENNKAWVERTEAECPGFFAGLSRQQNPEYLWIGCSDSRVPANQIVGLPPGDLFVHRNVGNLVVHTDMNCLSVIQYAVDVLRVKHIIVCGHYNCGGVTAAMESRPHGLVDHWIRHIRDVYFSHQAELSPLDEARRLDRLCELNVIRQVLHVCAVFPVREAWSRAQELSVHGWIYRVQDGLLRDLDVTISSRAECLRLQERLLGASLE